MYTPVLPYNQYTANGTTIVFPYDFYVIYSKDLSVYINSQLVTTGYSVTGIGEEEGGQVTFLTPPASGSIVYIARLVELYRIVEYADNGDLLSDTVNSDFDRIWMVLTQEWWQFQYCMRRDFWGNPWEGQGYRIQHVADPIYDQDVMTKKYAEEHYTQNNWRQNWNASTAYYTHDGVHYAGSSWYCENNNTGIVPGTNTTYWSMMAQKGDKGDKGDKGESGTSDSSEVFKTAQKLTGSLNNYKTPGLFYQDNNNLAIIENAYPELFGGGEMEVYYSEPNVAVIQRYTTNNSNNLYSRTFTGEMWTVWKFFADMTAFNNYYTKIEIDAMDLGGGGDVSVGQGGLPYGTITDGNSNIANHLYTVFKIKGSDQDRLFSSDSAINFSTSERCYLYIYMGGDGISNTTLLYWDSGNDTNGLIFGLDGLKVPKVGEGKFNYIYVMGTNDRSWRTMLIPAVNSFGTYNSYDGSKGSTVDLERTSIKVNVNSFSSSEVTSGPFIPFQ